MKTIGIIGGMSYESTALYYNGINKGINTVLGGLNSAEIIMRSVNFAPIEELQKKTDWEKCGALLSRDAALLERSGANFIILTSNTMHKVAPSIEAAIGIPLLHLAKVTADEIVTSGLKKIGLMGTAITMEDAFYKEHLQASGLEVVIPKQETRNQINDIIFNKLCKGIVNSTSQKLFIAAGKEMLHAGAEGLILGCTEIGMLIGQADFDQPVFDTTEIHIRKTVEFALS